MLRASLVATLLLLTPSLLAQPKSDVEAKGMHGPVHTVVAQHQLDDESELHLDDEETFNEQGWLTEIKHYGLHNQLTDHTIFKRNGRRMIECDATWFVPAENAKRIVTSFEEHGFPSQQVTYNLDGSVRERMTVIYEETQIRELHYDGNGKLITTRTTSTVHDLNSPERHIEQRANGKPEAITDLHQTPQGLEIKQKLYKDGKLDDQNVRDIRPDATGSAVLHADGTTEVATTRHQDIHEMVNPDGSRQKSEFNESGQRIAQDDFDKDGKLTDRITYRYETDDHGNWTRRYQTRTANPNGSSITVRTITYY
jgi:hypothetical protein